MGEPNKAPLHPAAADKIELLKRMMICHADLQTALSAVTFLSECDANEKYDRIEIRRFKCYETAFVIAYGRAFTKSDGSRHKQLNLKKIGVSLSEKERKLHESIISARHKKFAHSDLEKAHIRIDLHLIDVDELEFPMHRIQWDEGLDFIDDFVPHDIMDLTRKIIHALAISTRTLAIELKEHLPIYVTPN
jgi:hypothetical protein